MDLNSGLVFLVYVFLILVIVFANQNFHTLRSKLLRQERKLDAILQHLNIDWRSDIDPQLLKLIERGTRIEAVKAYKELNDVTLREAIDYVTSLRND
jgi:hypothetical protein